MTITALASAIQPEVRRIADDLLGQLRAPGAARDNARALHTAERVGDDFDVWLELLAHRAAALFVLEVVYVRALEDHGLVRARICEPEEQAVFAQLAPDLGAAAWLRWIFRDLEAAGLGELFGRQPAQVCWPGDESAVALLGFFRERDGDGELRWDFREEAFDGRLLGDLYQDLDPVVKERFALVQTPEFVLALVLEKTLEPAIKAHGAANVRVLDPACGSGHFLLASLRRIVEQMAIDAPEQPAGERVASALGRVVGIDLNDYAAGIARARLQMAALELAGSRDLADARALKPQVFWADALEQVERSSVKQQGALDLFRVEEAAEELPDGPATTWTPDEVRKALGPVLRRKFHVVVGNPPYIVERDSRKREYHKEKVGGAPRYVSAYRQYSLVCPFVERCGQLLVRGGFSGLVVGNQFMKREFGRVLIREVLAELDLTLVVDTAGAYLPGHGTPTALLFWRNQSPWKGNPVVAVQGKRGEPGVPEDAAQGQVWRAILAGLAAQPGELTGDGAAWYEDDFVSVGPVERARFAEHPWSLGGGGASELRAKLELSKAREASELFSDVGRTSVCGEDPVYILTQVEADRVGAGHLIRTLVIGEVVRDWTIGESVDVIYPYITSGGDPIAMTDIAVSSYFWHFRALLRERTVFGKTPEDKGDTWYGHLEHYRERLQTPLGITFAFVATHNHFALDRGGKVFKQSAPVIKLPADAGEDAHLAMLGLLNSSVACFWMLQIFHNKHGAGDGKGMAEAWMDRYEFDSTKLARLPIPKNHQTLLPHARLLDTLANTRLQDSATATITTHAPTGASALRNALNGRRVRDFNHLLTMVAIQEELDWAAYTLFDLCPATAAALTDPTPHLRLTPGERPFELLLAQNDAQTRAAIAAGEETTAPPTAWFERHGWTPLTDPDDIADPANRARAITRLALIETSRDLALCEAPEHKRRWSRPDYDAEERDALQTYLLDRAEDWAKTQTEAWTLEQLGHALEVDPAVRAACDVLAGADGVDVLSLVGPLVEQQAIPTNKAHLFSPAGLHKRAVWERVWALQRREDAGEDVGRIAPPPKYGQPDFLHASYFQLRGKLDVPRERFCWLSELPAPEPARYGWAGWTPRQRARAIERLDERLENQGVAVAARVGLLWTLQSLLPDVARESTEAAAEYSDIVRAAAGDIDDARLLAWVELVPPPRGAARRRKQ